MTQFILDVLYMAAYWSATGLTNSPFLQVHFKSTLFSLIRINLQIFMRSMEEMDQADQVSANGINARNKEQRQGYGAKGKGK
jgi:hypothetical protein